MPWFSDRAGPTGSSRIAPPAVLPSTLLDSVSTPIVVISLLNSPACTCPCQRFATPSRDVDA